MDEIRRLKSIIRKLIRLIPKDKRLLVGRIVQDALDD